MITYLGKTYSLGDFYLLKFGKYWFIAYLSYIDNTNNTITENSLNWTDVVVALAETSNLTFNKPISISWYSRSDHQMVYLGNFKSIEDFRLVYPEYFI